MARRATWTGCRMDSNYKRRIALLSAAACLLGAAPAEAKSVSLAGQVVAPPTMAKTRVSVPLLLSDRSERRLRLGRAIVWVVLPRRSWLRVPTARGKATARIRPSRIRVGD